ncbi:MAG: 6,7-dimethyl-8-ribityllumazine synthase [Limisphaerales bacterium]
MLTKNKQTKAKKAGGRFVIVASKYNARYVNSMLSAAKAELAAAGADVVRAIRVPGAYEIPVVAGALSRESEKPWSAIICLGVILRGATTHAQHIGESVSNALAEAQVYYGVPIVHEVLLLEDEQQAKARCLNKDFNRGNEAARTALEMARVMRSL